MKYRVTELTPIRLRAAPGAAMCGALAAGDTIEIVTHPDAWPIDARRRRWAPITRPIAGYVTAAALQAVDGDVV